MDEKVGAISYKIEIEIQCPYCGDIATIPDFGHLEDEIIRTAVSEDIKKRIIEDLMEATLQPNPLINNDVIYQCCECGMEAIYTTKKGVEYPPQKGPSHS